MKIKTKRGARRIRKQRVITRRFVTSAVTNNTYEVECVSNKRKTLTVVVPNTVSVISSDELRNLLGE